MDRPNIRNEKELKEAYFKRAEDFKRAAEIFKKAGNLEAYEDCLDSALIEELMYERGLKGNLFVITHINV